MTVSRPIVLKLNCDCDVTWFKLQYFLKWNVFSGVTNYERARDPLAPCIYHYSYSPWPLVITTSVRYALYHFYVHIYHHLHVPFLRLVMGWMAVSQQLKVDNQPNLQQCFFCWNTVAPGKESYRLLMCPCSCHPIWDSFLFYFTVYTHY